MSLVNVFVVPRFLGVNRLGTYATILTVVSVVSIVSSFGTSNQIVKSVARDPDSARSLVAHAVMVRLALWLPLATTAILIAATTENNRYITLFFAAALSSAAIGLVTSAINAALQGNQSIGRAAFLGSIIAVATQVATIAALIAGGGVLALGLVGLCFSCVGLAAIVPVFRSRLPGSVRWQNATLKVVIAGGLPFVAWDLALQIYGAIDYVLLAVLTDAHTVGSYAFAYRLASIPVFVGTIVTASVYASLAASAKTQTEWFKTVLTNAVRVTLVATLPMAVGLAVLAPHITQLVGGSDDFDDSIPIIAILACHIPLATMHTVLGTSLFALDRQRLVAIAGWTAALANPIVNLAAIPLSNSVWGNGAIGASVVTVATECLMGVWLWNVVGNRLERRKVASAGARTMLASLVMGASVYLLVPVTGVLFVIPVGAGVFAVAAAIFRVFTPRQVVDLRWLAMGLAAPRREVG
jgi:O-antigen/teichoic acid export membrane protein